MLVSFLRTLGARAWTVRHSASLLCGATLLLAGAGCGSDEAPVPQPPFDNSHGGATGSDAGPEAGGFPGDGDGDAIGDGDGDVVSDGGITADGGSDDIDPELCHLKGSQVVVLGDSYIALDPSYILLDTHPFTRNLEALAREAGALAQGDKYRSHALSGSSMAYWPYIPQQLDDALAADPDVKLVIMDGGGNDVLVNNRRCLEFSSMEELAADPGCNAAIDNAIAAGQKMFDKGVAAGIRAVIYFFYPHLPGLANGGIGGGTNPNLILDYAYPKVRAFCESQTAARCYFVDMRPAFDKDGDGLPDPGMINIDGIHPTAESSKILAAEVWKVMQDRCLASQ
jgi:lysophospholipase L1-like esterase